MAFVHANALICEKVLVEKDNVGSLVRVVDSFSIPTESVGKEIPIQMCLWVQIRLSNDDSDNHSLSFELIRPSGERTMNTVVKDQPVPSSIPSLLHKSLVVQGLVNVTPKELGEHVFLIHFDGDVVTKAFFTLVAIPEIQSPPPNSQP
jgi:hypothetical protein